MADSTRHIGTESLERVADTTRMELRLYVAAGAPNSVMAEMNLRNLLKACEIDCSLEIIDCLSQPLRALGDGVLVTPTLVKLTPFPEHAVIGTLSDTVKLAAALGILEALRRNGTYD